MLSKVLEMKQLVVELELNTIPSHFMACALADCTMLSLHKAPMLNFSITWILPSMPYA